MVSKGGKMVVAVCRCPNKVKLCVGGEMSKHLGDIKMTFGLDKCVKASFEKISLVGMIT